MSTITKILALARQENIMDMPPTKLASMERVMVLQAMRWHHGNVTNAAKTLGIGRTTLYRKLERYASEVVVDK